MNSSWTIHGIRNPDQTQRKKKKKTVKLASEGSIIARMPRLPAGHQLSGPSPPRRNHRWTSRTNYQRIQPGRKKKKAVKPASEGSIIARMPRLPAGHQLSGPSPPRRNHRWASRTNYPRIQPGRKKKKTVKPASEGSIIARMPRLPAGHQLSGPSPPRRNHRWASRTNYPRIQPARKKKKRKSSQAGLGAAAEACNGPGSTTWSLHAART